MHIDFIANDARTESAAEALRRMHTVRLGALFSVGDTPPDLLVLPIPATRDGRTLCGTPHSLEDCQKSLLRTEKTPLLLGYGACPDALNFAPYRDLCEDEAFLTGNAELTAEGGMLLLGNALAEKGVSLSTTLAVILGYGRIARGMAKRLSANGAAVLVGARRQEARQAAKEAGYLTFDCADAHFFSERGRLLFAERAHILVNTVPAVFPLPPLAQMPHPLFSLELSGKADVLNACRALPFPALDGKSIPTRYFPQTAGQLLAEAILRL